MTERIQTNMSDQWLATSTSKKGWKNYIPNHWTDYAENNNIDLQLQRMKIRRKARSKSIVLHGKPTKDIFTYKKRYVKDKYTLWYEKRALPSTHWTISEYKSLFKQARPDYARSFGERKIYKRLKTRYMKSFPVPETLRTMDNWFVERERHPKEKNQKRTVVAERILDISGKVMRVSLLFFGTDVIYRQEDKDENGKWIVTARNDDANVNVGPQQMINIKTPWSSTFCSVAQCY